MSELANRYPWVDNCSSKRWCFGVKCKKSRKVELQPTPIQRRAFLQHAGNARWAYTWGLERHKKAYAEWVEAGKPGKWDWLNAISLHKELNALKEFLLDENGVQWMYLASKCAPQEALRDLDQAFKHFRRRCRTGAKCKGFPKPKHRSRGIGGFRLTGAIKAGKKSIQLPRIGRVRIKPGDHGYLPVGPCSQVSVTERAGRWYVAVVGPEVEEAAPNGGPTAGIDLGVTRLATLSDGMDEENPKALARGQRKLRKRQREVARKKKKSANRKRARLRLARAFARVANLRRDAQHKATTKLTKSHGRLVIEDLQVRNMTRRGRGKRGLNRVLLDASFREFRRQLEYKGKLYGCEIVVVPPHYTSQRCSSCGHTEAGNRPSQAVFRCLSCGYTANADRNAAINIMVAGSCPETRNACGGDVRPGQLRLIRQTPVKQESAVVIGH